MDEFLSLVIFVLPGLIAFNLLKIFGLYPSIKHQNTEVLIISAIMWIPINVLVLGLYAIFALISGKCFSLGIPYVYNFETLNSMSGNFIFLSYYVIFSILIAYILAKKISGDVYKNFLKKLNNIRNKNGKASLSETATVWEKAFTFNEGQIVRINLGEESFIGEIKSVSTNVETEKDLMLRHTKHWTKIMNEYDVKIDSIYIDTKSGVKIEIFDRGQCTKAQDLYLENR